MMKTGVRVIPKHSFASGGNQNWFMRMFYCLAAVPPLLVLELCVRQREVVVWAIGLTVLSIMLSLIFYSAAVFRAFHHPIFQEEGHSCKDITRSFPRFVLAKLAEAALWLMGLTAAVCGISLMQSRIFSIMPEEIMQTEAIRQGLLFVRETFGSGAYLAFSAVSLFLQALVLISIIYAAAAASHFQFFERYKTLAGIFIFVLLYVFESDVSAALKKRMANGFGGIRDLLLESPHKMIGILTGIEMTAYLCMILMNVLLACYCLKKLKKGEEDGKGKKEEKI